MKTKLLLIAIAAATVGGCGGGDGGTGYTASSTSKAAEAEAEVFQEFSRAQSALEKSASALPVFRFYNSKTNSHFYTASSAERNRVQSDLPSYGYEGQAFFVAGALEPSTSAVYRFYNKKTGTHFYTISAEERDNVVANLSGTYAFDGPAWYASLTPMQSSIPIFRFFNTKTGTHFYTTSTAERARVIATLPEYSNEGIAYYVWQAAGDTPGRPVPTAITNVLLAQSLVFPSGDPELVLVENKDVLVLVNVIGSVAPPAAVLSVFNAAGTEIQRSSIRAPVSGQLPFAATDIPSFLNHYSVQVVASNVRPGMRIQIQLEDGFVKDVTPRVSTQNTALFVAIPVQIAGVVGQLSNQSPEAIRQRGPVNHVDYFAHATFTSSIASFPASETEWINAFVSVIQEIANVRVMEGVPATSRVYYSGFMPKTTFGLTGLGYTPGSSIVVAQMTPNGTAVLKAVAHEIGHNWGLPHAPCGYPANPDNAYPYPDARLGAPWRYTWGYRPNLGPVYVLDGSFVDPRNPALHDIMSYCDGDTFSDYNYRKIQKYLDPASAYQDEVAKAITAESQQLLLISGEIAQGKLSLSPLKRFVGSPVSDLGPYLARITTATGVREVAFDVRAIDHIDGVFHFAFSISDPGTITRIEILEAGKVLLDQGAATAKTTAALGTNSSVSSAEVGGNLELTWDATTYLSVIHVGEKRTTLALDLRGGKGSVSLMGLPTGGSFEFILSDGMNSTRIQKVR